MFVLPARQPFQKCGGALPAACGRVARAQRLAPVTAVTVGPSAHAVAESGLGCRVESNPDLGPHSRHSKPCGFLSELPAAPDSDCTFGPARASYVSHPTSDPDKTEQRPWCSKHLMFILGPEHAAFSLFHRFLSVENQSPFEAAQAASIQVKFDEHHLLALGSKIFRPPALWWWGCAFGPIFGTPSLRSSFQCPL